MRKHKTITISLPTDLLEYLDQRITEINRDTLEETNRSKYIRLLIRKDMHYSEELTKNRENYPSNTSAGEIKYYDSLLELGGYKR
ncbi:MAG: hypothetical protein H0Z40_09990 [Desulfotomaculum sp.]|nr:hypothetical protein [Desulfotomaculum sp.]